MERAWESQGAGRAVYWIWGLFLLGLLGFAGGLLASPPRAWKIYLVNLLFWSGLSAAGPVLSAVFTLTNAQWAEPRIRPVAESLSGFFPVAFPLYLIFFLTGSEWLYPWIEHPPPARAVWFSFPIFVLRGAAGLLLLNVLGWKFLRVSIGNRRKEGPASSEGTLAVFLILLYAVVFSLLAVDLIMALDPYWISTLFPAYFFMGNLYAGIAATAICAFLSGGFGEKVPMDSAFRDLGKILLGFCLLWTYLMWSQFLIIWYGNLPEELGFLMDRTTGSWSGLAWMVLFLCFILPFVALLTRAMKGAYPLFGISTAVLAGMLLERFLLVVPSEGPGLSVSWMDPLITAGFLGLFALSRTYLSQRPGG